MSSIVCKGTVPYWVEINSVPPYTASANDATIMNDVIADWLADKMTTDTEEDHWYLEESVAKGANPNSPPPRPF